MRLTSIHTSKGTGAVLPKVQGKKKEERKKTHIKVKLTPMQLLANKMSHSASDIMKLKHRAITQQSARSDRLAGDTHEK